MKKNMYNYLLWLVLAVVLTSCGGLRSGGANSLLGYKKGITYTSVLNAYNVAGMGTIKRFDFEFDNEKYKVLVPNILNSVFEGATNTNYATNTATTTMHYYYDRAFLIFKDEKLATWGYLYEFKNDPTNKGSQFSQALEDGFKLYTKKLGEKYE